MDTPIPRRRLGQTGIEVAPVAMGCWPITGITSVDVSEEQSLATLMAAFDAGINFFDTAYCYGFHGESEQMIAQALGARRGEIELATKGGIHWENGKQVKDARPETLRRECEESLRRLESETVELYYLHAPDPNTPVEESAEVFVQLLEEGKIQAAGASNCTLEELQRFHAVCPLSAIQPHYNMLQREIEADVLPWCIEQGISVCVYWPLMKGLLAGKLPRDYQFDEKDGRRKYPMFHGEEWQKNQDFLDRLRPLATECECTVAELVINWTIQRPGITTAICGAKRPEQIRDTAAAMTWQLTPAQIAVINQAIADRGPIESKTAV